MDRPVGFRGDNPYFTEKMQQHVCICGAEFSAPSRPQKGKVFRCPACRVERTKQRAKKWTAKVKKMREKDGK